MYLFRETFKCERQKRIQARGIQDVIEKKYAELGPVK